VGGGGGGGLWGGGGGGGGGGVGGGGGGGWLVGGRGAPGRGPEHHYLGKGVTGQDHADRGDLVGLDEIGEEYALSDQGGCGAGEGGGGRGLSK